MLEQFGHLLLFLGVGTGFGLVNLGLAYLVREWGKDRTGQTPYECGVEPLGTPYTPLDIRFYIFALLFVIFDVETLYLYPWAVAFRDLGLVGFVEMSVFIAILFLGLIYAWKKGALRWEF